MGIAARSVGPEATMEMGCIAQERSPLPRQAGLCPTCKMHVDTDDTFSLHSLSSCIFPQKLPCGETVEGQSIFASFGEFFFFFLKSMHIYKVSSHNSRENNYSTTAGRDCE